MKDLFNNLAVSQLLKPATATATQTSAALDLQGFNSACVLFAVGLSGDTLSGSVYWTLSLNESDDDSSYSPVAAADLLGGMSTVVIDDAAEDETVVKFGYIGKKRYLKGIATKTGTHTNGTPIAILGLRGAPGYGPVS